MTYRVPSMAEIEAVPTNGLTAVSTFSGCGGGCLGLRMAGYRVAWASEFIESARETYVLNHPTTPVDARDIREVTAEDIRSTMLGGPDQTIDLLEGSPPCSAFSMAGAREAGWGKAKRYSDTSTQVVDDLFFEYARLVTELQPRAFVAENVSGLVRGSAIGYFKEILQALKDAGYVVAAAMVDASRLGVPQIRQRVIFVGMRSDLGLAPAFPTPVPGRTTIRQATADLPPIVWVNGRACDPESGERIDLAETAVGREWYRCGIGQSSKRYFQLVRANPDRPCPTITAVAATRGSASVVHGIEPRKFSLAETRRLCGFPDDFRLAGRHVQRAERLGRAVPPPMMAAIARTIAETLQGAP